MTNSPASRQPFAHPPAPERPASPGTDYGTPRRGGRMVEWGFVVEHLQRAAIYWLATVGPSGAPHSAPVWGVLHDGELYLETSPRSRKARNLAADARLSLHVEAGPSEAVIVEGRALAFVPPGELSEALAGQFAAKYEGYRPEPDAWADGGLYRVLPATIYAWRDMPTATRWRF